MKRFLMILMAAMICMAACDTTTVDPIVTSQPSIAAVHTEFLQVVFRQVDAQGPNLVSPANKEDIVFQAAKEIADKYGVKPLTRKQMDDALALGREMAMKDPVELVKSALPPDQYVWWDRFASKATVEDIRKVYTEMCATYGAPKTGTMLADLVDISMSSAEFWMDRHASDEQPIVKNPYVPIQKGWKKNLIRFAVTVLSDGLGGAAAGAGTGGNVIVAGIVGGLCSYAVDDMIFGN